MINVIQFLSKVKVSFLRVILKEIFFFTLQSSAETESIVEPASETTFRR